MWWGPDVYIYIHFDGDGLVRHKGFGKQARWSDRKSSIWDRIVATLVQVSGAICAM
jgi:hypothetical protein